MLIHIPDEIVARRVAALAVLDEANALFETDPGTNAVEDALEDLQIAEDAYWAAATEVTPWVVVEGGLVQYQSGDWGGAPVEVVDLDFLKDGGAEARDEAESARDILTKHIHPMLPDGADLPRVESFLAWLDEDSEES